MNGTIRSGGLTWKNLLSRSTADKRLAARAHRMQIWKFTQFMKLASTRDPRVALKLALKEVGRRLYSDELQYGCRFDLRQKFNVPKPRIPVTIRELTEQDIPLLLNMEQQSCDDEECRDLRLRLLAIQAGLPGCHVGFTADGDLCCMCWLVWPGANQKFQAYFGESFEPLEPDQVLCEYMFTPRQYRGNRLMKYITFKLFEKAKRDGARQAIAFILKDNASSLAGARAIGWEPVTTKRIRWRLFRRDVALLPPGAIDPVATARAGG